MKAQEKLAEVVIYFGEEAKMESDAFFVTIHEVILLFEVLININIIIITIIIITIIIITIIITTTTTTTTTTNLIFWNTSTLK